MTVEQDIESIDGMADDIAEAAMTAMAERVQNRLSTMSATYWPHVVGAPTSYPHGGKHPYATNTSLRSFHTAVERTGINVYNTAGSLNRPGRRAIARRGFWYPGFVEHSRTVGKDGKPNPNYRAAQRTVERWGTDIARHGADAGVVEFGS